LAVLIACSSSEAPTSPTFEPSYHLVSIDGATLPINEAGGGIIDSGHVVRHGGDTVAVDQITHVPPSGGNPQVTVINHGLWLAAQTGSVIVLKPLAASSQDTAFLGGSDTLTLHTYVSGSLQVELYVAP
jgi:hypothetical protein